MKKVLLCLVLCYLMLCGCSEDSGKTAETTTPVLTVENVAEVVQTFNYTYNIIEFPKISEESNKRSATTGNYFGMTYDQRFMKSLNYDVNGNIVPALAVYDLTLDEYEIINFYAQNPQTFEWEIDTTLGLVDTFGSCLNGDFWGIGRITSREYSVLGDVERIPELDEALEAGWPIDIFDKNWREDFPFKKLNGVDVEEMYNYINSGISVQIKNKYSYTLYIWDNTGKQKCQIELTDLYPEINQLPNADLQCVIDIHDIVYVYYPGILTVLSSDGLVLYSINIPDELYMSERNGVVYNTSNGLPKLTLNADGKAIFCAHTQTSSTGWRFDSTLFRIDENMQSLDYDNAVVTESRYELYTGPLFELYYKMEDGLYGLTEDGKTIKLFDWIDIDISRSDIDELYILSPDKMYMPVRNATTREWEIYLITNESADDGREVIRIAYDADGSGVKSSDLAAYIREFNATNDAYRIEFVEYTTDKVGRTANEKLISDLLTGEAPDMILFGSSITPEKFVRQGLLIDMYSLMDGDYKKKDFLPCVRTPFENNKGELPYLVTDYYIETMIGKSSNFNGKTSWTFDEMLKMNASLKKDQTLMSLTMREGDSVPLTLLKTLLPNMLGKFVDYEKETCNFGEDFKKLLEFCKTAKVAALNGYISPSYYHDNEVLLNTSSYALQTFLANHHVNFAGDYTYIGYPEANGSVVKARTTFGITKRSDVAEGAWEFIELYLDEQTEKWEDAVSRTSFDYVSALTFPATYAAFDAMVENLSLYTHFFNFGMVEASGSLLEQGKYSMTSMLTPAADDEAGQAKLADTKLQFAITYTLTDDDITALYALVEGITTAYMSDPAAMNIILEDANDYFIGRKSLDEVVKLIKNRVGILVSE